MRTLRRHAPDQGFRRRADVTALLLLASLVALAPLVGGGRRRGGGGGPPPSHPEVLIVVNDQAPISVAIGEYYRAQRSIPPGNVLALSIPLSDPTLSTSAHEPTNQNPYRTQIRDPIEDFLTTQGLVDSIRIIVTTKGVPLWVNGLAGSIALRDDTRSSVDAELALLFSGLDGAPGIGATGEMVNPFYDATESFAGFRAANPGAPLRYMVARLTGYQDDVDPQTGVPADVKALIDRAREFGMNGTFLIDEDPSVGVGRRVANAQILDAAAATLGAFGASVTHETTGTFASNVNNITGYASWGSNASADPGPPYYGNIGGNLFPGSFAARALAFDIVSTNARSFTSPLSYGQSAVADLIRLGVAGAAGHVKEPFLLGVLRPHILLRNYAQGENAVTAYYKSVPYLGWMHVYAGDPLMTVPQPLGAAVDDRDGDGVLDADDDCIDVPDSDQRDTDGDGYGNVCDGDVDGDGTVTTTWETFDPNRTMPCPQNGGDIEKICRTIEFGQYDPDHDLDGDLDVDVDDLVIAEFRLFFPPGPSGLAP